MAAVVELRQLEYFVAVAEELGLGRAARRLHRSSFLVASQIEALEGELGLTLFTPAGDEHGGGQRGRCDGGHGDEHGGRGDGRYGGGPLRLTAAGEGLLPEARAALAAAAAVRRTAAGIAAGTDGLVRLGTSRAFADQVYRALGTLSAHRPRLRVRLERAPQEARLAAVRSGTFDASLVRLVRRADGLALHPVWTEPLIVALPADHPLAAHGGDPCPRALARLPLRLVPREANPSLHDLIAAAVPDWTPGPAFTTLDATLADVASAGEPSWTVFHPADALPRDRRLAFRALPAARVPVSLAVRAGALTPPLQALLEALTGTAPAIAGTPPVPVPPRSPVPLPRAAGAASP
ncbi:LysR substrate-binding domain-containing protein [Streptomyces sp. CC210A]|uniref:LysR family transcriptional regulator n=1 Tax=Streptomyces sp. CC210A TaxID=2898184 RepID=UPI001F2817EB|nr:LysR substrate-binding domain-containing protein [Streptomyces sp. CC210A]